MQTLKTNKRTTTPPRCAGSAFDAAAGYALSPTQAKALTKLQECGELVRRSGGYWTSRDTKRVLAYEGQPEHCQSWEWWFGTTTIRALESKGLAREVRRGTVALARGHTVGDEA